MKEKESQISGSRNIRENLYFHTWTIVNILQLLVLRQTHSGLVFVTGQGGAGFALGGAAVTQAWGPIFLVLPAPPPSRAQPHTPWTGPYFSPLKFCGGLSGAWVG